MIPAPSRPSQARSQVRRGAVHSLVQAGLAGLVLAAAGSAMGGGAAAQEGRTIRIADRCSLYGAGFVDIGDGTCARVVRQYGEAADLGQGAMGSVTRSPAAPATGGASHAALRSDGMLPGAADAGHLRVPGGLYSR